MRNIIPTLLIMVLSLSVFGQLPFPQTPANPERAPLAKPIDRAQVEALKGNRMPAGANSRGIQQIALDYDAVDEFETTNEGGTYERFIWDLNTRYPETDTNRFALTWGVVRYDTITGLDAQGNVVAYPRSSTSVTIDSVELFVTHENTQGTPDTIELSVYAWQGALGLQVNGNEDIVNAVLYDTMIITTTSLTPSASMLGVITMYPNLTLNYPNNRFLVGVHFYGDTANHTFTVLAGYSDRCGEACFAYPSVLDLNSLWRMIAWNGQTNLTGITNLVYNCNNNSVSGEEEECELFPIQNFAFAPYVTIDPALTALVTPGSAVCPGESVALSVTPVGGTGPYTVSWSPTDGLSNPFSPSTNATVSATTTYTATIIDTDVSPDTITKTVTITVNAITINAGNDATVLCGETTNLTATPGGVLTGATFAWSNNVLTLNNPGVGEGCYTITATNSFGCSVSDQVCARIPGVNQVLSFTTALQGCKDVSNTFTNTSTNKTGWNWAWTFGDASGNISTAENPSYAYTATGTYTITLNADSSGCAVQEAKRTITINICSGIEESWLSSHVEMYPNPTTGLFTLNFKGIDGKAGVVGVYDITGKLAVQESISVNGSMQKVMDLSKFADGVYFVKVQLGDGVVMRKLNVAR